MYRSQPLVQDYQLGMAVVAANEAEAVEEVANTSRITW